MLEFSTSLLSEKKGRRPRTLCRFTFPQFLGGSCAKPQPVLEPGGGVWGLPALALGCPSVSEDAHAFFVRIFGGVEHLRGFAVVRAVRW